MISAHKTNSRNASKGFTLLELIATMLIISVVVGSSAFFLSQSDTSDISHLPRKIEALSKSSIAKARREKQTQYIIFTHDQIRVTQSTLQDDQGKIANAESSKVSINLPKEVSIAVRKGNERHWTWLKKKSDQVIWVFSMSGVCEEISVILKTEDAEYETSFHPLTGLIISDS